MLARGGFYGLDSVFLSTGKFGLINCFSLAFLLQGARRPGAVVNMSVGESGTILPTYCGGWWCGVLVSYWVGAPSAGPITGCISSVGL